MNSTRDKLSFDIGVEGVGGHLQGVLMLLDLEIFKEKTFFLAILIFWHIYERGVVIVAVKLEGFGNGRQETAQRQSAVGVELKVGLKFHGGKMCGQVRPDNGSVPTGGK